MSTFCFPSTFFPYPACCVLFFFLFFFVTFCFVFVIYISLALHCLLLLLRSAIPLAATFRCYFLLADSSLYGCNAVTMIVTYPVVVVAWHFSVFFSYFFALHHSIFHILTLPIRLHSTITVSFLSFFSTPYRFLLLLLMFFFNSFLCCFLLFLVWRFSNKLQSNFTREQMKIVS